VLTQIDHAAGEQVIVQPPHGDQKVIRQIGKRGAVSHAGILEVAGHLAAACQSIRPPIPSATHEPNRTIALLAQAAKQFRLGDGAALPILVPCTIFNYSLVARLGKPVMSSSPAKSRYSVYAKQRLSHGDIARVKSLLHEMNAQLGDPNNLFTVSKGLPFCSNYHP
jgi:hypothetical protein